MLTIAENPMSNDPRLFEARNDDARRALTLVLAINLFQALAGVAVGLWAQSTGLIGMALDNFADAAVFAISLLAIRRGHHFRAQVARLSAALLMLFSLGLVLEVLRRFFSGAEPVGLAMIATALVNAALNMVCVRLLSPHRDGGAHLKASWIFAGNDTLANFGIALSGLLVLWLATPLPDLLIGLVVAGIALHGAFEILEEARKPAPGVKGDSNA